MRLIKRYLPLLCNLVAATIFGFTMLFIKTGMRAAQYDAVKYLAFRYVTGFVVLTLLLAFRFQRVSYRGKPVPLLLLCGGLNPLVSQVLETMATSHAPTSQIAVIHSLIPVCVVLFSIGLNREFPTWRQVVCMLVSVAGVMLIHLAGGQMGASALGLSLVIGSVLVIAVQRALIRRASGRFTAFEIIYVTTGMGAAGFSLTTVLSHASRGGLPRFFDGLGTSDFIIPVLYMGIFSCVIAFLCLTYASGHLPIAVSSSTSMFSTVISILVGVLLLGESFRAVDVTGSVIAIGGMLAMSLSYNAGGSNRYPREGSPCESAE